MTRVFAVSAIAFAVPFAVSSDAAARPRQAALVLDANTGRIIHNSQGDTPVYPASLTKMMTLYMVFEQIEVGRMTMSTPIRMTETAAAVAPSKLELEPGETILLADAIKAVITKSANDVATALAEHIGGSEQNFARLMTNKARALGMTNSTFRNASGLPDPGQTTTARDMTTLALHLQDDFPKYYGLFSTRTFTYKGDTHRNHNTLLFQLAGTDGIKTGYTRASGFNLVSSVKRDGKHLVAAIFGGVSAGTRNAHMRMLLYRGFSHASTDKTRKPMLIARLKAPPKLAERKAKREEPRQAALVAPAPKPAMRPEVRPAPVPQPDAIAPPASMAQIAEPAVPIPAPFNVEIAQVKPVPVTPHLRRPAPGPDETTDMPPAALEPEFANPNATAKFDFRSLRMNHAEDGGAAPLSDAPATSLETVVAKPNPTRFRVVVAPAPAPLTVEALIEATATDAAPMATPAPEPPAAPSGLGIAPSTLAAQASAISTARANRPAQVAAIDATPRLTGGYQIQIGAYGSETEAQRQMASLSKRAAPMLANHTPVASPVRKGEKQIYRARFTGFDAPAASKACLELRRLAVDCFVMRPE